MFLVGSEVAHCWEYLQELKLLSEKYCDFEGKFVILREKIKKDTREICYAGGKSCPACQKIFFRPGTCNLVSKSKQTLFYAKCLSYFISFYFQISAH